MIAPQRTQSRSELLRQVLCDTEAGGRFPGQQLLATVRALRGSFDVKLARAEGVIIPEHGLMAEYDEAVSGLADCEQRGRDYLAEQGRHIGAKLTFVGNGRARYQVG